MSESEVNPWDMVNLLSVSFMFNSATHIILRQSIHLLFGDFDIILRHPADLERFAIHSDHHGATRRLLKLVHESVRRQKTGNSHTGVDLTSGHMPSVLVSQLHELSRIRKLIICFQLIFAKRGSSPVGDMLDFVARFPLARVSENGNEGGLGKLTPNAPYLSDSGTLSISGCTI
ncbi:uncharacterized protein PG986_008132 [Apiospora aurea]|uniref:Uncharacterized protein n=1 Tax=Apiospora aurea TaxID=335848 RepID=A0ABR1QEJ5_9PEZI